MIVTATEMAKNGENILDQVIRGEVVEVQRHGNTIATIQPKVGVSRNELVRLLRGRGFTDSDERQFRQASDATSEVFGYAGRD